MIYLFADDLTGAADTGAQFAKRGYHTQIIILPSNAETWHLPVQPDVDVLVIDTETRDADTPTARNRLRAVLKNLPITPTDVVYKKIDSTFRGQIAVEIEECLRLLPRDLCLLTPTFPPNQRMTVGGYLIVEGRLVGGSAYDTSGLPIEEASYLPTRLQHQINVPIARIDLREVLHGDKAVVRAIHTLIRADIQLLVADAIANEHLQVILRSGMACKRSVLFCGSAGLANALAEWYQQKCPPRADVCTVLREPFQPILLVIGSRREVNQRQIAYLKRNRELFENKIDVGMMLRAKGEYLRQCAADIGQALDNHRLPVIYPDLRYNTDQVSQALLREHDLTLRDVEVATRAFLGDVIKRVLAQRLVRTLVIVGGDTAIGVCSALELDTLRILDELLPGIPLSVGYTQYKRVLNIVTKAGGFGEEVTLHTLIQKLLLTTQPHFSPAINGRSQS